EATPGAAWGYALNARFLPEITLEDINAFARNWIAPENRVVTVTAPAKPGLALPTEDELRTDIESASSTELTAREEADSDAELLTVVPEGSPVVSTRELEGGLTEWMLENGVRVLLKPTRFRED